MSLHSGSLLSVTETEETKVSTTQTDNTIESVPNMTAIPESTVSPEFLTPVSETSGAPPSEAAASSTSDYDTPTTEVVANPINSLDEESSEKDTCQLKDSSPAESAKPLEEMKEIIVDEDKEVYICPKDDGTGTEDNPESIINPKVVL